MSKYSTLWEYVQSKGSQSVTLTFEKIQSFAFLCLSLSVSFFPVLRKMCHTCKVIVSTDSVRIFFHLVKRGYIIKQRQSGFTEVSLWNISE